MVKNKIIMLLLSIFLLTSVSAVQYYQQSSFVGNDTTKIHASFFWGYDSVYGVNDNIKSGNQLESYVWYNIYPNKWNEDNPDYAVEDCNITITFFPHISNTTTILFTDTLDENDDDAFNIKYFVNMDKGDGYTVDVFCKFSNARPSLLELPADFTIVSPTWECKACQKYEWSVLEQDVQKAKTIDDNRVEIWGYIKDLISLNYEILIALFWMILIGISFLGTSLIFVGVYWLFLYLRSLTKI